MKSQLLRRDGMKGLVPECEVTRRGLLDGEVSRASTWGSCKHGWIDVAAVAQKDIPNTVYLLEFPTQFNLRSSYSVKSNDLENLSIKAESPPRRYG